ncbi:MAG TPA: hypothetical protein PKJ78_13680 [Candidatus Hydrogenedentes bacterium]|nr:hypothetical protein [Candidatus Hydrogenedentota bacterium]
MVLDDMPSHEELRSIYEKTQILRKPTYGIVSGYHELPYILLGESFESGCDTMRVKGTIHVSPRFIIRPTHLEPSYGEIFGEDNVDVHLMGRIFGFLGFRGRPIECKSEHLEVKHFHESLDKLVASTRDEFDRYEDIVTGLIITPDARYYPVSIERFISAVLEDEFGT